MPRYRVRLQSPQGPHYRVSNITADSREEAIARALQLDRDMVENPDDDRYDHPYELAYCVERGETPPPVTDWPVQPPAPKE